MATRKPRKTKFDAARMTQTVLEKLDPMQAAIMILGGTAAANGIVPPLTRLLQIFSGGAAGADVVKMQTNLLASVPDPFGAGQLIKILTKLFGGGQSSVVVPDTATQAIETSQLALFCSGAVEAMIMYRLVSNPDVMKGIISMPGEILQGVGSIVPG